MAKNLLKAICLGTALIGLGYNCTCNKKEEPKNDAIVKSKVSDYFNFKFPSDGKPIRINYDFNSDGKTDLITGTEYSGIKCIADVKFLENDGKGGYHERK